MTTPTSKEMELIHAYGWLMEKFRWMDEHGKTRRDYQNALREIGGNPPVSAAAAVS
jgi:hypothetical protein